MEKSEQTRIKKLDELIEDVKNIERQIQDLDPARKRRNDELVKVTQHILERARSNISYTGDWLKDLSIFHFGVNYEENYKQLLNLENILKNFENQFVLIHDTSSETLVSELNERDKWFISFRVAALGIIESGDNPLDVGFEEGRKYYLKLRFKDQSYIRELEVKEEGKIDKLIRFVPTYRGRVSGYTEKPEPLKLVVPEKSYNSSEEYIRKLYAGDEAYLRQQYMDVPEKKSKKPYWRIDPDRFDVSKVIISSEPFVEIFEEQEFPKKTYKVFALYIGNEEISKRLGFNLDRLNDLRYIYDVLNHDRGKKGLSLIRLKEKNK
jgi:hypothetical protein